MNQIFSVAVCSTLINSSHLYLLVNKVEQGTGKSYHWILALDRLLHLCLTPGRSLTLWLGFLSKDLNICIHS